MTDTDTPLDIYLVALPGHETALASEAKSLGFGPATVQPGGVTIQGDWSEVWRANLQLRGVGKVLVRLGSFRAMHLAQLDKRAHKFPWAQTLRPDIPLKVDVVCKRSRIYHAKAATQRIETALKDSLGVEISAEATLVLKARIEDDLCTFSLDTSGEPLHKRGHKEAIGKAPLRETMAALFLQQMGYDGTQTVVDPMCGSGTICIEAAEIAMGLAPGRSRSFAFEHFASFDAGAWDKMRSQAPTPNGPLPQFFASDRDAGAVKMAGENAARAGVGDLIAIIRQGVSELQRPDTKPGIVLVNPPYGARIGNRKLLFSVYGALGKTLLERFSRWRVGIITSDEGLAKASALPFKPTEAPVSHGGLRVTLFQTDPLP